MVAPPRRAVPILPLAPLGGDSAWEGEHGPMKPESAQSA
jgi:hypothetical protein